MFFNKNVTKGFEFFEGQIFTFSEGGDDLGNGTVLKIYASL